MTSKSEVRQIVESAKEELLLLQKQSERIIPKLEALESAYKSIAHLETVLNREYQSYLEEELSHSAVTGMLKTVRKELQQYQVCREELASKIRELKSGAQFIKDAYQGELSRMDNYFSSNGVGKDERTRLKKEVTDAAPLNPNLKYVIDKLKELKIHGWRIEKRG
ncbi:hypothetical protein P8825_15395 [Shouchella clausii]|uniref:hypothetical protein n=1 Tax=Shouchella clausii TaxID=79880 RepID=UPI002DBE3768|nr:hypothetical protein [Shouchella clausii]MEB5480950.1 hypothetical protein [Shouchella clausii]